MSLDINIVTARRPSSRNIVRTCSGLAGVKVDIGNNILVSRRGEGGNNPCFTIDGPFAVKPDDVDEEVLAYAPSPNWLIQFAAPIGSFEETLKLALKCAEAIARKYKGAVFDPQQSSVVWPRAKTDREKIVTSTVSIQLVEADWYLPPSKKAANVARQFLSCLKTNCPEAIPHRYGEFEPMQFRFEPEKRKEFVDFFARISRVEWGSSFFWSAHKPCLGGLVFFPDQRVRPKGAERRLKLSCQFDGRVFDNNVEMIDKFVNFFIEMSRSLNAFYAIAFVARNYIVDRGIWADDKTEQYPFPRTGTWQGIPKCPGWLLWFGKPYKRELRQPLLPKLTKAFPEGLFIRAGVAPMDLDQLQSFKLRIPADLLYPAKRIPRLNSA